MSKLLSFLPSNERKKLAAEWNAESSGMAAGNKDIRSAGSKEKKSIRDAEIT